MSKVRFELDIDGVRDNILNAEFTLAECKKYAEEEAQKSYGSNYHMLNFKGIQRAHSMAFPNTKEHPG